MYVIRKLLAEDLNKLKHLVKNAVGPNSTEYEFLRVHTNGLLKFDYKGKGNFDLITLSKKNNPELINLLENTTGHKVNEFVSVHHNIYQPGAKVLNHKDSNSNRTFVFLLQSPAKGGIMELDGNQIDFSNEGDYIEYNGGSTEHGVTEVTEGIREVLVVWVNKIKSSVI